MHLQPPAFEITEDSVVLFKVQGSVLLTLYTPSLMLDNCDIV